MIVGIVLAAGQSRRMGRPKPLLEMGGETFLSRSLAGLIAGGCEEVLVVVGPTGDADARMIADEARDEGARVVVNPVAGSEQIDSLRVALRTLPDHTEAAVVTPIDVPMSGGETVAALVRRYRETGAPIVVPVHGGDRGHPVLFARAEFGELASAELPEGARSLIRMRGSVVEEVEVDDPAVLVDVDTPEDYRRLPGSRP